MIRWRLGLNGRTKAVSEGELDYKDLSGQGGASGRTKVTCLRQVVSVGTAGQLAGIDALHVHAGLLFENTCTVTMYLVPQAANVAGSRCKSCQEAKGLYHGKGLVKLFDDRSSFLVLTDQ